MVALEGQLHAFDANTLAHTFSAVTHPSPVPSPSPPDRGVSQSAPVALGARWLAYASNQVFLTWPNSHVALFTRVPC